MQLLSFAMLNMACLCEGRRVTAAWRREERYATANPLKTAAIALSALEPAHAFQPSTQLWRGPAHKSLASRMSARESHDRGLRHVSFSAANSADVRDAFLALLKSKDGDAKDAAIEEELERLQQANPTPDPALTGEFLDADWLQVSQSDYPDKLSPDEPVYTLGRLAFSMYEPTDMKFRIDRVLQPVRPFPDDTSSSRGYEIKIEMTSVDERYPEFKAVMCNYGVIGPTKSKDGTDSRLTVSFTRGNIAPSSDMSQEALSKWKETFSLKKRNIVVRGVMKLAMGLENVPMDEEGIISYKLNRPPEGWLDILYLDEKLRVTRGNRGSVVVCTRE